MTYFGRKAASALHASQHELGGADEIDISGLLGTVHHDALAGLDDDDHTQYHTNARGDDRYPLIFKGYANYIHGYAYESIIAGTWSGFATSNQILGYYFYNTSGAQNDEIEYEIFAEAGEKTFELLGSKQTDAGIITVYLDGTSIGTIDQYAGSAEWDNIFTLTFTVVDTKIHSLKFKCTDKNGSSSNYYIYITGARIY